MGQSLAHRRALGLPRQSGAHVGLGARRMSQGAVARRNAAASAWKLPSGKRAS
jgi:hypothetical protein